MTATRTTPMGAEYMESPLYQLTIRTPEAQARADRRTKIKRGMLVAGLIAAFLAPGATEQVDPSLCHHVWVC